MWWWWHFAADITPWDDAIEAPLRRARWLMRPLARCMMIDDAAADASWWWCRWWWCSRNIDADISAVFSIDFHFSFHFGISFSMGLISVDADSRRLGQRCRLMMLCVGHIFTLRRGWDYALFRSRLIISFTVMCVFSALRWWLRRSGWLLMYYFFVLMLRTFIDVNILDA